MKPLYQLKQGEFFKRVIKGKLSKETYTRDTYDFRSRSFHCSKHSDVWGNGIMLRGKTIVETSFGY